MAKKKTLLERMHENPRGDWTMENVKTLCKQNGVTISKPSSGSHFNITSEFLTGGLTVPRARPIKAIYIKHLVALCKAHNSKKGSA